MTYQPHHDPNQQPASGPPAYGPPQAQQQYGPPGGQPYGAQPGYQQPVQPPKKRKKWPFVVGGIVIVMILGCVGVFTLFGFGAKKVADGLDNNVQGRNAVASGAAVSANGDASTFLEQINPGNTVKGKLVFDVPKGTKLASVVLHESMFTEGVKVPLQ